MRQIKIRIVERSEAVLFIGLLAMFFCMIYSRYGLWSFPAVIAMVLGSVALRDTIRVHRRQVDQAGKKKSVGKRPARKRQNGWTVFFHIVATFAVGIFLLYRWASGHLAHYWYPTALGCVLAIASLLWIPDLETVVKKRGKDRFDLDRFGTVAIFLAWGGLATLACLGFTGNLWHYWYVTIPVAPLTVAGLIAAPDMDSPVPQ